LIFAARTRNGFTPTVRADLVKRFNAQETDRCPFINLHGKESRPMESGLTTKKVDCRWLKPELVGQFEFLEWTGENTCGIRDSSRCETTRIRRMSGRETES
jgi:hypothetical protein